MTLIFDGHTLDLERRELRRGTELVTLEPRAFDLLAYIVRHCDRVVGREELFQTVWHGRIVSDAALTTRINAVRRAIGDSGREQRLVRTLQRKGIRFVGDVTEMPRACAAVERCAASTIMPAVSVRTADRPLVVIDPFVAISGGAEERRFADGLAEDLVTALARFRWMSVLAPVSPSGPGGAGFVPAQLPRERGARYSVQGAVRRDARKLRVTARLVDTIAGAILWTDGFEGSLEEGLSQQHKIAAIMAASIEPSVLSAEARRCSAGTDREAAPYDLRMRAQPIFSSGRERVLQSLRLVERAIELDPSYELALADAANCRQILDVNGWAEDRRLNRCKAVDLAQAALHVSTAAEAVGISAFVLAYFGQDADAATALIDEALRLNPNFAKGWYMSGFARLYAGQPEQAVACFETSIRLNPQDRLGRRNLGGIGLAQLFTGHFDDAVSTLRPIVFEFPHWATPYCALASCHAYLGFSRESEAVARQLKAANASPVPRAVQFRNAGYREMLAAGGTLAGMARSTA